MIEADSNTKYLGMPSILGRNKTALLGYLKDKVMKRVQRWDGKWISKGGKEVLIKNVVQTLPSFAISVFLPPLEITKEIERILVDAKHKSSIHWMNWIRMSKNKVHGGLDFQKFLRFQSSYAGKARMEIMYKCRKLG